jgi:drug/metabolite transporter (DMT)-like permease
MARRQLLRPVFTLHPAPPGQRRYPVPASALALALCAALIHATWNLLLARARDTHAATAVALCVGALVFAPVTALTWRVEDEAVPYLIASAALELGYLALLAIAYSRADLSAVYPVARGSAPVLVLVVSITVLGASLSTGAVVGVLLVGAGVLLIRGLSRGGSGDLLLGLGVGACIAGYTLVDKEGLRHAAALPYLELELVLPAVAYAVAVAWSKGGGGPDGRRRLVASLSPANALLGIGMFGSYGLVLAALQLAPAAPVAAARETSIVIATAFGALLLHERVTRARLAGAVTILAGVAVIALA